MRFSARRRYELGQKEGISLILPELNFATDSPEVKQIETKLQREYVQAKDHDYERALKDRQRRFRNRNLRNLVEIDMRMSNLNYLNAVD